MLRFLFLSLSWSFFPLVVGLISRTTWVSVTANPALPPPSPPHPPSRPTRLSRHIHGYVTFPPNATTSRSSSSSTHDPLAQKRLALLQQRPCVHLVFLFLSFPWQQSVFFAHPDSPNDTHPAADYAQEGGGCGGRRERGRVRRIKEGLSSRGWIGWSEGGRGEGG